MKSLMQFFKANKLMLLREVFFLLGNKRKRIPWMVILFLAVSLIELVGLGLIAPYMLLILNPESLDSGVFGQLITQVFLLASVDEVIIAMSLMLASIFMLKAVFAIAINRIIIAFSLNIQAKLRSQLMSLYQGLDYTEYLKRNSSEYITAIQSYTSQFTNGTLANLLRMVSEGVTMIVITFLLAYNNGTALLLLMVMLGALGFGYDRLFRHKVKSYGQEKNINQIRMTQGIQEGITGFKEVRILAKEDYFHQIVHDNAKRYSHFSSKTQVISIAPRYLLELILVLFIVLLVMFTLWSQATLQSLIPTLSLFGFAAIRLIPSANVLINGLTQLRSTRDATTRLYQDLHKQSASLQAIKKEVKTGLVAEKFEILKFKLIQQRKELVGANRHTGIEAINRDITLCLNLIEHIQEETYNLEYQDFVRERMWFSDNGDGTSTWNSEIEYENFTGYFLKYRNQTKRLVEKDPELALEENKMSLALRLGDLNQSRCQALLFKILNEKINRWWD